MTKHTPGPWKIWQTFYIANDVNARPRLDICTVESGNVADVQLIAAAPDMLEALEAEEHAQSLEEEYGMFQRTWTSDERAEKWRDVEMARHHAGKLRAAAIAKAKGQAE